MVLPGWEFLSVGNISARLANQRTVGSARVCLGWRCLCTHSIEELICPTSQSGDRKDYNSLSRLLPHPRLLPHLHHG